MPNTCFGRRKREERNFLFLKISPINSHINGELSAKSFHWYKLPIGILLKTTKLKAGWSGAPWGEADHCCTSIFVRFFVLRYQHRLAALPSRSVNAEDNKVPTEILEYGYAAVVHFTPSWSTSAHGGPLHSMVVHFTSFHGIEKVRFSGRAAGSSPPIHTRRWGVILTIYFSLAVVGYSKFIMCTR